MSEEAWFWLAAGLSVLEGAAFHDVVKRGEKRRWWPFSLPRDALPPLPATLWLWIALGSMGLTHLVGCRVSFEAAFAIIVFSGIPAGVGWTIWGFRRLGHRSYPLWCAASLALCAVSSGAMLAAFQHQPGVSVLAAVLGSLPYSAIAWTFTIRLMFTPPDQLFVSCGWRRKEGRGVTVFLDPGSTTSASEAEFDDLVRRCDWALDEVVRKLEAERPCFKVAVFLFSGTERFHRYLGKTSAGCAFGDAVALAGDEWSGIRAVLVHEFCHVVAGYHLKRGIPALLNEGLAEYVETEVTAGQTAPPRPSVPTPLRFLAMNTVFRDTSGPGGALDGPRDCYTHAHAFVRYLVETYGLAKLKVLCSELNPRDQESRAKTFARAIEKTYAMPLHDLERDWRRACGCGKPMW